MARRLRLLALHALARALRPPALMARRSAHVVVAMSARPSGLMRVTLPRKDGSVQACFGLIVENGAVAAGAPYGMAILRRKRITDAREAWRLFERLGGKCEKIG